LYEKWIPIFDIRGSCLVRFRLLNESFNKDGIKASVDPGTHYKAPVKRKHLSIAKNDMIFFEGSMFQQNSKLKEIIK